MIYRVVSSRGMTLGYYAYQWLAQEHVDYIKSQGGTASIEEVQQERDKKEAALE